MNVREVQNKLLQDISEDFSTESFWILVKILDVVLVIFCVYLKKEEEEEETVHRRFFRIATVSENGIINIVPTPR